MQRFTATNANGIVHITVLDDRVLVEFVHNDAPAGVVVTDVVPLTTEAMHEIAALMSERMEHEQDDHDLAIMAAEMPPDATVH